MARVRALRRSGANCRAAPPAQCTQGWPEGSAEVAAESSRVKVCAYRLIIRVKPFVCDFTIFRYFISGFLFIYVIVISRYCFIFSIIEIKHVLSLIILIIQQNCDSYFFNLIFIF